MKKKKNKGKKTLTAMSAVVAAGLTPGIIAATPACMPVQNPVAEITAAEVVAIAGQAYGFDELYAMQQESNGRSPGEAPRTPPQVASKYAAPPPKPHATYYGVPRPDGLPQFPPQSVIVPVAIELDTLQWSLMDYCAELIDADAIGLIITLDSDLTRELGMDEDQLKALKAEIERRYNVDVSYHRFYLIGQLNTLRLVSEYIYKLLSLRN